MAEKKGQTTNSEASELSTIRNILMGQQMAEYQAEFAKIHQEVEANKSDLSAELKSLGGDSEARITQLEKEVGQRFDRLEKLLADNLARLDAKLLEMSKADKQDLGQMLAEISKKLTS